MENKKWHWQPFDKVDKYQLDTPITDYLSDIIKLERYEEEESDTYRIDTPELGSMLYVSDTDGLVKAIQSSCSFVYQGYEFMGEPTKKVVYFLLNTFGQPLHKYQSCYYMYINPKYEIRIDTLSEKVVSVIVTSWGNHDK